MKFRVRANNREKALREHDLIVSKTAPTARITHGQRIFVAPVDYLFARLEPTIARRQPR